MQGIAVIAGRHSSGLEDPVGAAPSSPPSPSDAELVRAALGGDRGAWAMLYARFAPMVHGVLLSRMKKQDADDLTQDVFVQAMRRLGDVRDGAAVGAWLAAIARNAAVSRARRNVNTVALTEECARAKEPGDGRSEEAERVLRVIRELPEAYRETLVLRLVEGLTGPQIATRMGMTHGSVRVNLHRGMQILKERLAGLGLGGGEIGGGQP